MRVARGLAALLLLVPGATAAMTLEVTQAPLEPLAPETGLGTIAWTATIDCSDLASAAVGLPESDAILSIRPQAPGTVGLAGATTHAVDAQPCLQDPSGAVAVSDAFAVGVGRDALADDPLPVTFNATLERGDADTGALDDLHAEADTTVTPAPFFLVQVVVDQKVKNTAGGPVTFDIHATNHGNSPVEISFALVDGPQGDAKTWFQSVDPVRLEWSGAPDGRSADTQARFEVPGPGAWTNEQAAFTIAATPTYEGQSGEPHAINLLLRHRGSALSNDAPTLGPAPFLLGLAAVAVALRRL